ncbi:MAG: hypothetical protein RLZZ385_1875 [Pseudomonadota bacterium]
MQLIGAVQTPGFRRLDAGIHRFAMAITGTLGYVPFHHTNLAAQGFFMLLRLPVQPKLANAVAFAIFFTVAALGLLAVPAASQAQQPAAGDPDHPGRPVYEQNCATCHGNPEFPRAHAFATLRMMNATALNYALTEGLMAAQGSALTEQQREQVVAYLADANGTDAWVAAMMCAADARTVDLAGQPSLLRFGVDANNSRHLTAEAAGLTTSDMGRLELAWAVGFPGTSGLRASPVIIGDTIFYAATDAQKVLALDTASGCAKWVYSSATPLRSSLAYGLINGKGTLVFGDITGLVHAVDAASGEALWVKSGQASNNQGMLTGSPVIHENMIIVPISGSGVLAGGNPRYECCENHGAVTALDAASGDKLWEYHTMPAADYNGMVSSLGVKLKGPSGAPIWSTPTVDAKRGQVYVTTGENTSHPTTGTSDAIIAIDLATGEEKWVFQALANDMWNYACANPANPGPNCVLLEGTNSVDYDFGSPAILVNDNGRELLLAGQKSGDLWAVDPDTGAVIWNQRVGDGTALGGNHWGIATDYRRAFHAISDPVMGPGSRSRSGLYTFFVGTGEPSWSYEVQPDCAGERAQRVNGCQGRYGFSATPLSVDGAVITAGLDGRLFIFNSETGELLFQYDTAVDFETANGVPGKGGSIDAHSIAAGGGMVFIGSGYGQFSQTPGNVLLAFRPRPN